MMEKHWRLLFCFLSSTAYVSSSTISRLEIIPERTYLILLEGDPLQLECHAIYSGNQTVFHFYKDLDVITTDNKFGYEIIYTEERVKLSDNFETYKITTVLRKNITQFGDKGHYECKALDSVPVTIIVEIFSGFSTNADLSTEGTESVELECTVNIPAITKYTFITYNMFWEHDGKRIEENERFSCYNGTLQFHYPTRSDLGIYQCVITFFPDSLVEKQSVRPNPSLLRGGPQIDYYSKSRTVMVGEFLDLRCEASGFPTPKVTWYQDNQEIVADSNMRILEYGNSTSYLNITSINKNDEGEYVCRAKNPVPPFTTSADIYVTVKEKSPDVSSSLSVHSHTSFLSYLLLTMMTFITFLCSSYLCK